MEKTMKKYRLRDVLVVAAYFTKHEGYKPVSAGGTSTKERVLEYLNTHTDASDLSAEYQPRAEKAIQWIQNEKDSDWIKSLKDSLSKKEVEERVVGLVSSIYAGYDKFLQRDAEKRQLQHSEFQGRPKQNIEIQMKTFRILATGKNKYDTTKDYYLTQIIDQDGNVYIWFADKDFTHDLERCQTIYAVVKAHNEREGVKQTIIDVHEID
jgi:hypothetical protein